MPIRIRCTCGTKLQAKDEHVGKKIKCPKCAAVLTVEAPAAAAPPLPLEPELIEEGVTEAPPSSAPRSGKRRRRDDDDEDDAPRRPKAKSNAWIIWLVLGLTLVPMCCIGTLAALLLPAVSKVREAAARTQSANNFKQIGLGVHNYHDVHRRIPPHDKNGLSWRVEILPFIEQANLYQQFKLDEPWDSPANRPLLDRMPKVFEDPMRPAPPGHTFYQAVVGPKAFFSNPPRTFGNITDGLSNTLMLVEGAEAVPWTKPADVVFDENGPLPPMGEKGRFLALYGDASIGRFGTRAPIDDSLRSLLTATGNEQPNFRLDESR